MVSLNLGDLEIYQNMDILRDIDILKIEIDRLRPLDNSTENRIMQKFRLDWNYNSNAIEGNSLDYGETVAFLMHGLTAKGKPLKDHLDIKGHNETIEYLIDLIRNKEQISEKDVREIHKMLLVEPYSNPSKSEDGIVLQRQISIGKYKTMPNHVQTATGETHYYASPEDTPFLMRQLIDWFRESVEKNQLHPVIIAAVLHHRLTSIHPFDDGNGRMSRLLMNLVLMQYGFPPVVIKKDNRNEYYQTLSQADAGDDKAFIEYIGRNLIESLSLYLKGAKGESVDEPTDLKKKVELFRREIGSGGSRYFNDSKDLVTVEELLTTDIKDFLLALSSTLDDFNSLFINTEVNYRTAHAVAGKSARIKISDYLELPKLAIKNVHQNEPVLLSFDFINFKATPEPFSLSIWIALFFNEYEYQIRFAITENDFLDTSEISFNPQVTEKKYYQYFEEEERSILTAKIGNDLLLAIQNHFGQKSRR